MAELATVNVKADSLPALAKAAAQFPVHSAIVAVARVAGLYRIAADQAQLAYQLAQGGRSADGSDLVRAGRLAGFKVRNMRNVGQQRLLRMPIHAIVGL